MSLTAAYVILYIQLILWWLTYLIESIYKMAAVSKEAQPMPGQEMGADFLEEPTWVG
jgi:hypothetical protein